MRKQFGQMAISAALLALAGCGAKWTAVPEGDQRPLKKLTGLVEPQADVEALVATAKLPNDEDPDVLVFRVEVTNWRSDPIRVPLSDFALKDDEGRLTRPLTEPELRARFDLLGDDASGEEVTLAPTVAPMVIPAGGATVQLAAYPPFRALRRAPGRCRPYPYRYYYNSYYNWYDPWYYPYYYPYGYVYGLGYTAWPYDATTYEYEQRRELVRFLSETWQPDDIEPKGVQRGYVLFAYPSKRHDQVTLTMNVQSAGKGESKQVASFAFRFTRTR